MTNSEYRLGETHGQRMREKNHRVMGVIGVTVVIYLLIWLLVGLPGTPRQEAPPAVHEPTHGESYVPPFWAAAPFVVLLLAIAALPLIPATQHWWHDNKNRFLVAFGLGLTTLAFYAFLHEGGIANHFTHSKTSSPGLATAFAAFSNGILGEYIPFIVLLFSLYVISGGISLTGDLPAHPRTNLAFIASGTALASFIGTTGAAMVLIRPLIATNLERKHKTHTFVFFLFCVCNCGGLLLPIGDPPLFLGYLRGVPFTWTLQLWPYWLGVNGALLLIYFCWDWVAYRREKLVDLIRDEADVRPLKVGGLINLAFLLGVVLCVALVVPGHPLPGTSVPAPVYLREALMLLLAMASLHLTRSRHRVLNRFNYEAIVEVAAIFLGIFLCMQVPIEILKVQGASLGVDTPAKFFWATGILSSFLDNAPTYVVFFEMATVRPVLEAASQVLLGEGRTIMEHYLVPISLGAVFMGANTYIGNGPNFMVKSIVEQSGGRMPSFIGYMGYALLILTPLFAILTFLI